MVVVADQQLASIDKRLPRLTLRLSASAPAGVIVTNDGAAVEASSLGSALAMNPGVHHITVSAPGHSPRTFDVTLTEGDHQDVAVQVGALVTVAQPAPARPPAATTMERAEASGPTSDPTPQVLTYGALGLGGVGIAVGIVVGVAATSKHSTLEGECSGNSCPSTAAQSDIDSFHSLRTWSTIGYVVGIAGLVGGATLWLTAPKPAPGNSTAQLWIGPASAGVAGAF